MAESVYILCAMTSLLCAVLLARSYRRTRAPLLVWGALCFAGLTLNSILLFVDLVIVPSTDLSLLRGSVALAALLLLLFGLVWDSK